MTLEHAHVPLIIREGAGVDRRNWPVTGGVPFAMGRLRSADQVRLLSPDGYEHPAQLRATARWPDGSVRWLLVHFQATVAAQQTTTYYLDPIAPQRHPGSAIMVASSGEGFEVATGNLRVQLNTPDNALFGAFQLDDQLLVAPGIEFTVEAGGNCYRASADRTARWVVQEHGPLRTVFTTHGSHTNAEGRLLDFEVSLQIYTGLPWVEIAYTFLNRESSAEVAIDTISVELPLNLATSVQHSLCGAFEDQYETTEPFVICQDRPAHAHGGFRTARIETTDGSVVDGPREGWRDVTRY